MKPSSIGGGAKQAAEKLPGARIYDDCNHPVARLATPPQLRRGVFSIAPLLDREGGALSDGVVVGWELFFRSL